MGGRGEQRPWRWPEPQQEPQATACPSITLYLVQRQRDFPLMLYREEKKSHLGVNMLSFSSTAYSPSVS